MMSSDILKEIDSICESLSEREQLEFLRELRGSIRK